MIAPLLFEWTGDSFKPLPRHARACDEQFTIGERYNLDVIAERSQVSHSHYFAALHEAWVNIPEDRADQFPTVERLRKHALIETGWRDERSIVCASKAEALRVAAFIRPMDEYAVVIVRGCVVLHLTAKSQSYRAMGKEDFGKSKQAVLDFVSSMIGVEPKTLEAQNA